MIEFMFNKEKQAFHPIELTCGVNMPSTKLQLFNKNNVYKFTKGIQVGGGFSVKL